MTNHETPALHAVLTVTVATRPDGGHYFDQADFAAHVGGWVRSALRDKHAVAEVTVVDQAAELARAQAEVHQYRTALQGVARKAAVSVPPTAPRAALLLAVGVIERMQGYPRLVLPEEIVAELRRLADEAQPAVSGPCVAGEQQNETPEAGTAWGVCPGCKAAAGPDCDCPRADEGA